LGGWARFGGPVPPGPSLKPPLALLICQSLLTARQLYKRSYSYSRKSVRPSVRYIL